MLLKLVMLLPPLTPPKLPILLLRRSGTTTGLDVPVEMVLGWRIRGTDTEELTVVFTVKAEVLRDPLRGKEIFLVTVELELGIGKPNPESGIGKLLALMEILGDRESLSGRGARSRDVGGVGKEEGPRLKVISAPLLAVLLRVC
jgi:hypothetical protein